MWQVIKKNPAAAIAAILAHLVFIVLLTVTFVWDDDSEQVTHSQNKKEEVEIIHAKAIDEAKIQAELNRLEAIEQRKKEKARKVRDARIKEEKRLAALKKKRQEEEKKRKAKQKAEEKRLAELKKKRGEEEKKRQQEAKRLAELEKKRKAEEEKLRQAEQARLEQELKKKLEVEQQQRNKQKRGSYSQAELNKYRALIKAEVTRHWNIPSTAFSGMVCDVRVRLIPSGDVVSVQVIKSSGDQAFDRSVETAVYKAAPLPVPSTESGLFEEFREVIFSFDPKNRI